MAFPHIPPRGGKSILRALWEEIITREAHPLLGIQATVSSFSLSGKLLLAFFATTLLASTLFIVRDINAEILVEVPARGGAHTEAVLGTPRFINPLLALSEADRDLTALVYSGLLRNDPQGGLIHDLAKGVEVSEDGKTITAVLKENIFFHDNVPVTADDVVFTIGKAQEPSIKSPRRANWEGVSVEKVDDRTVRFSLRQPYAPFLQNLTMGILPAHLWRVLDNEQFPFSELNIEPVGSGPYKVSRVARDSSRVPKSYTLAAFKDFALGEPYLSTLRFFFFRSEGEALSAYLSGNVDAVASVSPQNAPQLGAVGSVYEAPLMRVFSVFFNQGSASVFSVKEVRAALGRAVDREALIAEVLGGFGSAAEGPLPPSALSAGTPKDETALSEAAQILEKGGWKKGADGVYEKKDKKETQRLSFTLSTGNVSELKSAAEYLARTWGALGAAVEVKIYEVGDLNQDIIRPRKFEALLFGAVIGRESDLFAFWHSSQRNDPGLNIAMYVNSAADRLLEETRRAQSEVVRKEKFAAFEKELAKDSPAIFLYAPSFLYAVRDDLSGIELFSVANAAERFLNVHTWYKEREYVWNFLSGF